ncbi:MAG: VOC family protein [Pseudomonadota bacterium]
MSRGLIALICAVGLAAAQWPAAAESGNDALAPSTSVDDARTGPLHTATLITNQLDQARLFFVDGMGLTMTGPHRLPDGTRDQLRALWGIPAPVQFEVYRLNRPGAPGAIQVRLLVIDRATPAIHASWRPTELGPFSLGFPTDDLPSLDLKLRRMGFGAMNPMSVYEVPRPDGTKYPISETIFTAPEFLHAVGINRGDGMAQLGPVDPDTGLGGPAYSAQVVADSDAQLKFYTDVLGMELRSDREWKSSGSTGAMGNPDGAVFRFSIVYSMGATSGHLLFVHFRNVDTTDTGVAPRPPNRGLVMWSFPVRDLDQTREALQKAGTTVVHEPVELDTPSLGRHRAMTVLDPNGMLIELFERLSP